MGANKSENDQRSCNHIQKAFKSCTSLQLSTRLCPLLNFTKCLSFNEGGDLVTQFIFKLMANKDFLHQCNEFNYTALASYS